MSGAVHREFRFADGDETSAFASALAPVLHAGDTILLQGGLGAGKTHFARALIQARLSLVGRMEDVPSPTFTLVQTYDTGDVEIWHCDLYRLTGPDEVFELGLDDAFEAAICLVEWPDRLGDLAPPGALTMELRMTDVPGERLVRLHSAVPRWNDVLDAALAAVAVA